MKKILVLFILAFPFILKAQTDSLKTAFVAKVTFDSISTVNDSVLEFRLKEWSDALFEGYLPSQIEEGFGVIDGAGRLFRIDTVLYSTISTAKVRVVKLQERTPADPTGIGAVFEFLSNGMIPAGVSNNLNLTPVTVSRISIHNAVLASEGGGSTNLTYTASPTQGTVNSDTGNDAVIPAADGTNAGLLLPTEKTSIAAFADSVATGEIKDRAVTLPKLQNIATNSLLGRFSSGAGLVENPTIDNSTLKFTTGVLGVDPAVTNYWTLSGSNLWRNSNVGVGVDPASVARFVTRGSGTTTSTITSLFEASDGRDILEARDDGRVLVSAPVGVGFLQIATSVSVNADMYFGASTGTGGLLRHNSGVFTLGSTSSAGFRFTHQTSPPTLTIGTATSAFNGYFRAQGSSVVQIPAAGFTHYTTGNNITYANATSTNLVAQYQANTGYTQSAGGSATGYNVGFVYNPSYTISSSDTTNFKIKLGAYLSEPTISINPATTIPYFHFKAVSDSLSLGTRPIYDFWSNTNSGNNSRAIQAEGTAPSYLRGSVVIGADSDQTPDSGTTLDVEGRISAIQYIGQGSAPSATVQSAAGTSATATVSSTRSTESQGSVSVTTGSGSVTSGRWVFIPFGTAYSVAPAVTISGDSSSDTDAGGNAEVYPFSVESTNTGFYIRAHGDPSALTSIRFDWMYIVKGKQ